MKQLSKWIIYCMVFIGCNNADIKKVEPNPIDLIVQQDTAITSTSVKPNLISIDEKFHPVVAETDRHELVEYAKTLSGITYKYASTDPAFGFDCSGFITYVFNHFNIAVPRSSVGFTNVGKTIETATAKEGDLILFTGTVDSIRVVGHMGIVTENSDTLKFIHSTSGKANGVTISPLNEHYKKRFVKVIRVFED